MDARDTEILLRVLGDWFFSRGEGVFASLPEDGKKELCAAARPLCLAGFFAWYVKDALPVECRAEFVRGFHASAARELGREASLKKTQAVLEEAGIDYIPLKGSFLAYEVYPHPALRPRVDVDLLLREADLKHAAEVFHQLGWRNYDERNHSLHIPGLVAPDNRTMCELHFGIFHGAGSAGNAELWNAAIPCGGRRFLLPPELTLLQLIDGAVDDNLQFGLKPLADSAMLIAKFNLTAAGLREAAEKYSPSLSDVLDLLFAAFPEFYPEFFTAGVSSGRFPAEVVSAFRALPLLAGVQHHDSYGIVLEREFQHRSFAERCRFLLSNLFAHPANVRKRYNLPPGRRWNLPFYYLLDLLRKAGIFFKFRRGGSSKELASAAGAQAVLIRYLNRGRH
ncbi:MAG: nucleotidyltransferase family protein [Victivallaceae bacterium]|nr:nucleotidyltransferase family protein [Victivallaceae bacterium]